MRGLVSYAEKSCLLCCINITLLFTNIWVSCLLSCKKEAGKDIRFTFFAEKIERIY